MTSRTPGLAQGHTANVPLAFFLGCGFVLRQSKSCWIWIEAGSSQRVIKSKRSKREMRIKKWKWRQGGCQENQVSWGNLWRNKADPDGTETYLSRFELAGLNLQISPARRKKGRVPSMDANALELGWEKLRRSGRLNNWKKGPSRANLTVKVLVEICFLPFAVVNCLVASSGGHKDIDPLESSSFAGWGLFKYW